MVDAAKYSAIETLRDGRRVEIRALRPEDRSDLLGAVDRVSPQSLYRRFFAVKRGLTDQETDFFVNVDFVDHVALLAVVEEDRRATIVGGGRYILVQPGKAEVAFAVIDEYQGQGGDTAPPRPKSRSTPNTGARARRVSAFAVRADITRPHHHVRLWHKADAGLSEGSGFIAFKQIARPFRLSTAI